MITDLFLQMSLPDWLFALLALVLAGAAFGYYYRTLPPLSPVRRTVLVVLRGLVLVIVLFLILEPVLRLMRQNREKPVIGVLLDNSASMKIAENYGLRGDSLRYIAREITRFARGDSLDIRRFIFDTATRQLPDDSLRFDVDASNISQAVTAVLDSLSGENLQAVILVSDGVFNQGANPFLRVQNSPVPFYTVLVGDSTVPRDVAVRRVQTNQITYVNKKLPVEVTFWQNGFDGQKGVITIAARGKRLAQRSVTFGKSGFEQKEILEIVADQPGDFNYTVRIQPPGGEITDRNNQQVVRVQVLKSKLKVLVLSGTPNFDRQVLSFAARQLTDYTFTFLTEKSSGQYFEKEFAAVPLDSQDLFLFHNFPTPHTSAPQLAQVFRQIRSRRVPVFWLPGNRTNFQKVQQFRDLLPFEAAGRLTPLENQIARLTGSGRLHPVMTLDESAGANALLWRDLPPVWVFPQVQMRSGAQVLLESTGTPSGRKEALPILFVHRQNEQKHLVLNAANFSNWHYQLQEDPARDRLWIRFLERAVRWLASRDDIHQVQIQPLQSIYNVGEPVVFSGQVFDEFYRPISDARVTLTVGNDSMRISDEMVAEGNGFYRQSISGLPEGEFTYTVSARRNEQEIGTRRGKLTVNPFFLEFQEISANPELLRQIARATNGRFYTPARFLREFSREHFQPRVQLTFAEFFMWTYWHWLALLVWFLGMEWWLRKRWGLL